MGLSYGQTASLGQGIEGIGNAVSNIFDPRIAAAAAQSRLSQEAAQMEMKYKPQLFQSQIAQNQASAGAAGAAANLHNVQAEAARQRAAYGQQALNIPVPQGTFPGVPYAADVKAPPSPQAMQDYQNAVALRLNAYGGGNSDQYAQSIARIAGLNAQDEMSARRAQLGVTGQVTNTNQAFTPEMQGNVIAAQGANDVAKQAEVNKGNLQQELLKAYGGIGGTGPNGMMKLEDLDKYVQTKFSVPGGELSPEMIPAANSYKSSMAILMSQGLDPMAADDIASKHHGAATYSNPYIGSPRMEAGKGFNLSPISRDQAVTIAEQVRAEKMKIAMDVSGQFSRAAFPNGTIAQNPTSGGITAGMPNQAPPPPNQPVSTTAPATGPIASTSRTGPITLGEKAAAKKAGEKSQKDLAYNKKTMDQVKAFAQKNNVDIPTVVATVLAGGPENQDALSKALFPSNQPSDPMTSVATGYGQFGRSYTPENTNYPSFTDIQNAVRSSEIQKMFNIDPSLVNQYIPQGNSGQTQIGRFIVNQ
jgi:hypothetical protein